MFSDIELVNKILDGQTDLFEQILDRYERQILVYCLRMLNFHQQDAEDVVSETFTKVYLNLANYNPEYKLSTWIYKIAHNQAINFAKKTTRQKTFELSDFLPVMDRPTATESITKEDLEKVLNQLKPNDRAILIMFYLEELSLKEIGEILKLTENTVAQRLKRARSRAQKIVNQTY